MKRKTWIVVCLVVLLAFGVALAAGAQAKKDEKKLDLEGQKLGLIFNVTDILLDIGEYIDGVQGGLGLKYWLGDKMALRALLDVYHNSDSAAGTSTTTFGLSGAFEYHFTKGKVSPYTGGLLGVSITTGDTSDLDLYLAGILGAEVRVLDYLGLFGEYNLRLRVNEPDFWIEMIQGNNLQIGVIVYLP